MNWTFILMISVQMTIVLLFKKKNAFKLLRVSTRMKKMKILYTLLNANAFYKINCHMWSNWVSPNSHLTTCKNYRLLKASIRLMWSFDKRKPENFRIESRLPQHLTLFCDQKLMSVNESFCTWLHGFFCVVKNFDCEWIVVLFLLKWTNVVVIWTWRRRSK